jgi:threonine synthase
MAAMDTQPRCSGCGHPYPELGVPHRCPHCGESYDLRALPPFDRAHVREDLLGLWRYREWLAVPLGAPPLWLGEGRTPLVPMSLAGSRLWCKLESLNPTGSFKDRGSVVLVAWLRARGIGLAVEDSSGNAGASLAAYCAAAAIEARVYAPSHASDAKLAQIESYGARLERVPGPREESARRAQEEAQHGAAYASHAYLPFGLSGIATIAFEIWEALGRAPQAVVLPAGHGTLAAGLLLGFTALLEGGNILRLPRFVLCQAEACAPVFAAWRGHLDAEAPMRGTSRAEGILINKPVRLARMLQAITASGGIATRVSEVEIDDGWRMLNRAGISCEPTSAVVVAGVRQALAAGVLGPEAEGEVVLIVTGHGLKSV